MLLITAIAESSTYSIKAKIDLEKEGTRKTKRLLAPDCSRVKNDFLKTSSLAKIPR